MISIFLQSVFVSTVSGVFVLISRKEKNFSAFCEYRFGTLKSFFNTLQFKYFIISAVWFSGRRSVLDCHGVFKTTSPLQNINGSCNELLFSYVHHEYCWIQFDFSIDEGASVSILCFYKDATFFLEQAKYSYFLSILGWKYSFIILKL